MSKIISCLTLSTNTLLNQIAPIGANINSLAWNIRTDEIFANRKGTARMRAKMISVASSAVTYANNIGELRVNFTANQGNNYNGVSMGPVEFRAVVENATNRNYLFLDTMHTQGVTINIPPAGQQNIQIIFLDYFGSPMQNVPNYQIWLYFEFDA